VHRLEKQSAPTGKAEMPGKTNDNVAAASSAKPTTYNLRPSFRILSFAIQKTAASNNSVTQAYSVNLSRIFLARPGGRSKRTTRRKVTSEFAGDAGLGSHKRDCMEVRMAQMS